MVVPVGRCNARGTAMKRWGVKTSPTVKFPTIE